MLTGHALSIAKAVHSQTLQAPKPRAHPAPLWPSMKPPCPTAHSIHLHPQAQTPRTPPGSLTSHCWQPHSATSPLSIFHFHTPHPTNLSPAAVTRCFSFHTSFRHPSLPQVPINQPCHTFFTNLPAYARSVALINGSHSLFPMLPTCSLAQSLSHSPGWQGQVVTVPGIQTDGNCPAGRIPQPF